MFLRVELRPLLSELPSWHLTLSLLLKTLDLSSMRDLRTFRFLGCFSLEPRGTRFSLARPA